MNNTTNQVEIPIKITTEFTFESEEERTRLQIEQTGMYISALFWFVKNTAKGHDLLDLKTETKLFEFQTLRGNLQIVSEIGEALADQLSAFTNRLAVLENKRLEKERLTNEI